MVTIHVSGTPAPKGSNRAVMNKHTGRAMMIPGGNKVYEARQKSWASAVREAALDACSTTVEETPLVVAIEFRLARPKSVKRDAPMVKPDIDKLARCTLDALIGVAFDDDSRIVDLLLRKKYTEPGLEGASILVKEWQP